MRHAATHVAVHGPQRKLQLGPSLIESEEGKICLASRSWAGGLLAQEQQETNRVESQRVHLAPHLDLCHALEPAVIELLACLPTTDVGRSSWKIHVH